MEHSIDNPPDLGKQQRNEKSQGPEVYWIQRTLKDLGYYDTKCTGHMLKKTVRAVKAFQQDHGLPATGQADLETQQKVLEG